MQVEGANERRRTVGAVGRNPLIVLLKLISARRVVRLADGGLAVRGHAIS